MSRPQRRNCQMQPAIQAIATRTGARLHAIVMRAPC